MKAASLYDKYLTCVKITAIGGNNGRNNTAPAGREAS